MDKKKWMPTKLQSNKKIYYHGLYIILIVTMIALLFYSISNINYINGQNLKDNVNVIVIGEDTKQEVTTKTDNEYFGIFAEKNVQIKGLSGNDKVYNTFKLDGLVEYQKYTYDLKFRIKGLDADEGIIVGSQLHEFSIVDTDGDDTVVEKNNYAIDLTNSKRFHKGTTDEFNVQLEVEANQVGEAYVYIGIDPQGKTLDYSLSHISLVQK